MTLWRPFSRRRVILCRYIIQLPGYFFLRKWTYSGVQQIGNRFERNEIGIKTTLRPNQADQLKFRRHLYDAPARDSGPTSMLIRIFETFWHIRYSILTILFKCIEKTWKYNTLYVKTKNPQSLYSIVVTVFRKKKNYSWK